MAARNDAKPLKTGVGPVVSSAHLARSSLPALSEVEFALTMANHAFQRWMVRCMTAAGRPGLSPLEMLIVHLVNHRERPKSLADICLVLNVEDTHLANYAIKKLARHGLVKTGRKGKEKTGRKSPRQAPPSAPATARSARRWWCARCARWGTTRPTSAAWRRCSDAFGRLRPGGAGGGGAVGGGAPDRPVRGGGAAVRRAFCRAEHGRDPASARFCPPVGAPAPPAERCRIPGRI
jgi:hypothetical protein